MASKVNLADLIDDIDQQDQVSGVSKSSLKKRLDSIHRGSRGQPLNSIAQNKLERKAAYNLATKEISKWQETVTANKNAPQLDLTNEPLPRPSIDTIVKNGERNSMQKEIDQALGITYHDSGSEEETNITGQRAKLRSQMFHQYLKQKRIAKIKSKLYHKIKNKHKEKEKAEVDEDEAKEQEEMLRIQERISLKHSKANKYKKSLLKYSKREHDAASKGLNETEELRKRIMNPSRMNSEGKLAYESSSDEDEEFLAEQLKLELEDNKDTKGVLGMKFMQEAIKRQREKEKYNEESLLEDLQKEESQTSKFKFDGEEGKPKKKKKTEKQAEKVEKVKEQQDLIDEAFGVDEMDQVAAEEWAKDEEAKQEKQPKFKKGWGRWTGSDIKEVEEPQKPQVYKTDKVLIDGERDKRAAKYLVKQLPFPFKTSRQFDAVHKIPLGKDWNSKKTYQQLTAPEILTRPGEIISPISASQIIKN
ncbi:unnamed protein product [Blepharisma stoltei]|uniref:U3 small nucleolar RNA-associated protein 14 n=1 Tax=Blepharisma stoltei TaxID=1481888 RepID=A0AAU9IBP8_9CILI|nr:unnamed protein product [Blepharisma stoltei]